MKFEQITAAAVLVCCSSMALAGAWDVGSFDNDDALDWVWELTESDDLSVVKEALHAANSTSGYLEAPTASIALAAAEVVAALKGKPSAQLPDEVSEWVQDHKADMDGSLIQAAKKAIERVQNVESSELAQLWSDSDEAMQQWHSELRNLALRLE